MVSCQRHSPQGEVLPQIRQLSNAKLLCVNTKGPDEPFSSPVTQQFRSAPAEEGTLGLIEHLHLCPPVSSSPTSDSVQRPMPQQNLSQEHFTKSSPALHITPMEVATFNGQNTESTNFLKPRNNMQKCTDLLSAKACERIPVREIICNSITDTDHYKLQQIW